MITLAATEESNILTVKATGKLTKENYEEFGPKVEALIHQHGKIRYFDRAQADAAKQWVAA